MLVVADPGPQVPQAVPEWCWTALWRRTRCTPRRWRARGGCAAAWGTHPPGQWWTLPRCRTAREGHRTQCRALSGHGLWGSTLGLDPWLAWGCSRPTRRENSLDCSGSSAPEYPCFCLKRSVQKISSSRNTQNSNPWAVAFALWTGTALFFCNKDDKPTVEGFHPSILPNKILFMWFTHLPTHKV